MNKYVYICVRVRSNGEKIVLQHTKHEDNNKGHGKVESQSRKLSEIDNRLEFV